MLKSDFFSKNLKKITKTFQRKNIFFMLFLNIYTGLGYFIRTTQLNQSIQFTKYGST